MAKADGNLHFRCQCGKTMEAVWKKKLFGKEQWIAEVCPVCHTKTDLTNVEVIPCPYCQSIVLKGEKFCLECNQPLDVSMENQPIACPNPNCGMMIYLPKNYRGDYLCQFCHTTIKAEYIASEMKQYFQENAPAKLIVLPGLAEMEEQGLIVFKEMGTQFPYKSRVQVNEGTYGLLLQNGICQYPLTPGTHLLSDSQLTKTARYDAAMDGEDVVFNTEIYCVVKKLPELKHALISDPIPAKPVGAAPAREYTVEAEISVRLLVDDAKAFVSRIGFKKAAKSEMAAADSWLYERTRSLTSSAFHQAVRSAVELYEPAGSLFTCKTELARMIREEVSSALAEDGLCVDTISVEEPKFTETPESVQRQKEYKEKLGRIVTVKLPDVQAMQDEQLVIYQHNEDCFEYKSRVQVSEGTYGLLLQNGACQEQLLPGSYLLADCALEGSTRYDAAMNGQNVVFSTNLFSVIKLLPGFEWYHTALFIDTQRDGDAPAKEYNVCAQGTLRLQVDDAKAFATHVGFRKLSFPELFHAYRPGGQLPSLNVEIEKNYPAGNRDGWLYTRVKSILNAVFDDICQAVIGSQLDTHRIGLYRLAVIHHLENEFNNQLHGTGLSVAALELFDLSADETKQSRELSSAYQQSVEDKKAQAEQNEKNRDALLKAAKTQFRWEARDVELHLKEQQNLTFAVSFNGDCRLQVQDEELFFALPEVQQSQQAGTPDAIFSFLQQKLQTMIGIHLAHFAQELIDHGKIADPADRYAYRVVVDYVQDEIDRELSIDGLKLHYLSMRVPDSVTPSRALQEYRAINDKMEKIRSYAESMLALTTSPIRIHMKDDPTVYVNAVFSGRAYLRVVDPDTFFETSEVKRFLSSDPFVSSLDVASYYADRINPLFADMISRVVQAIVEQTNADIRELNRLSGLLQSNLLGHMNDRVSALGMRLESLDMGRPEVLEKSDNMLSWTAMHNTRSGIALQKEIERLENEHAIFSYNEDKRVAFAKASSDSEHSHQLDTIRIVDLDSHERLEEKKAEMEEYAAARARKQEDRAFQEQLDQQRKQDELDRLVEEITSDHKERGFDELQKEYERKYILREREINQTIREAQLRQQADFDTKAREEQARFHRVLNDAENKRALEELLHKIDESNLDWRRKLDEYARLQRKVAAADEVELELLAADGKVKKDSLETHSQTELDVLKTKAQAEQELLRARTKADAELAQADADYKIRHEENETFLLVGETKIKLASAEAELLETISRCSEDRQQRVKERDADLTERRAKLDFEQRMRERQESVAQQMEMLQQKFDHELALRDRDDKLTALDYEYKKLVYILDHLSHELNVRSDVDKTRIQADEEIRKAEAQYNAQHAQEQLKAQEARLQQQLKQDEEDGKRAAEYQKMMAEIQLAIEKLRQETQRNQDDNQTKVAVAQAQSNHQQDMQDARRSIEQLNEKMDQRYHELQRAMDRIADAHKSIRARLHDLSRAQKAQPIQYPPQPYPVYPGVPYSSGQPMSPNGISAYNKLPMNDIALTGGLGRAAPANVQEVRKDSDTCPRAPHMSAPIPGSGASSRAPQPGMYMQTCPSCGKPCSIQATICEHCGASL